MGWIKWKNSLGVLCDKRMVVGLKSKVYRMVVRSTVIYGAERWPIKKA